MSFVFQVHCHPRMFKANQIKGSFFHDYFSFLFCSPALYFNSLFVLAYFALLPLIGSDLIPAWSSLISSGPQCLSVDKDK